MHSLLFSFFASIIELLIKKNFKVFIIDNLSTGYKKLINKKAIFYKASIHQDKLIRKIILKNNIESIIHLAAKLSVPESEKKPKEGEGGKKQGGK